MPDYPSYQTMKTALFLARKILSDKHAQSSNTLLKMMHFTVAGVALCFAVMLLTIFIGKGFRQEVKQRMTLLTGDLFITPYKADFSNVKSTFTLTPELARIVLSEPHVSYIRPVVLTPVLLQSHTNYCGALAVGMDSLNMARMLLHPNKEALLAMQNKPLLLNESTAVQLNAPQHSKVLLLPIDEKMKLRQVTLSNNIDIPSVGATLAILPISFVQQVRNLNEQQISRLDIFIHKGAEAALVADNLVKLIEQNDTSRNEALGINTSREELPAVYDWIDMLDANIYLLLTIMAIVAGCTIITGLLVMILGRTRMVGVLKAIGASNKVIRQFFFILGSKLILRAFIWGNIIAFSLATIQYVWHPVHLDSKTYYISYVPIAFSFADWAMVSVAALVITLAMVYIPTQIVARIRPSRTLRFS